MPVTLSNATGATISDSRTSITLLNDDLKAVVKNSSVAEGGAMPFTLTLKYPLATATTVNFCTVSGTAVPPGDYTYTACSSTTSVVIPAQSLAATSSVPTNVDNMTEGAETFTMRVAVPAYGFTKDVRGTIKANHT